MSEKEELMIDFVNMNALIATCNSCSSKWTWPAIYKWVCSI
jgi:hypothetical protein